MSRSNNHHNNLMELIRVGQAGITHPFGDERSVLQAFPSGISAKEADPFLMCDYFSMPPSSDNPFANNNKNHDEDFFPVDWHPHRGFDIASYLKSGVGRHGDSLGNRETFETPGMQWMSTGSGVYHAEGGGRQPPNTSLTGFQIWINVPSNRKMDDPRYGTVPPKDLPTITVRCGKTSAMTSSSSTNNNNVDANSQSVIVKARVLAGSAHGVQGPFETVQPVQMVDWEFYTHSPAEENETEQQACTPDETTTRSSEEEEEEEVFSFDIAPGLDTAMLYVYEGELDLITSSDDDNDDATQKNRTRLRTQSIAVWNASDANRRRLQLAVRLGASASAETKSAGALLFAGKKLNQPIAWHGPIVMTTQAEIQQTMREIRNGQFPPKRVPWDYTKIANKPLEEEF
ncbi:hypothetical protein ACA910_014818 [Epithemia clementina (nom. ined.)]